MMRAAMPLIATPRRPGAACWLIGASCLVLMLVAAAAIALSHGARRLDDAGAGRLMVRVVNADADRRIAAARRAVAVLKARDDVAHVRQLGTAETARLIAAFLPDVALDELPLPIVLDVSLRRDAEPPAVLRSLAPVVGLEAEPAAGGLAPLARLVDVLRGVAAALGLAAMAAAGLASVLAARASIAANRATIAILHGLGATDGQIARAIHGIMRRDIIIGGLAGTLLAVPLFVLIAHRVTALGPPWTELLAPDPGGWLALALVPVALVVIAAGVAYAMIAGQLARAP